MNLKSLAALATLALPMMMSAQVPTDAFQVNYASNLNLGDGVVNITNTGSALGATNPYNRIDGVGNICVNIYGYVPDEQQAVCCSCNVSPNSLHSFPIVFGPNALFSNPFTAAEVRPSSVIIKLVATVANSNGCPNPARTPITPGSLAPGLRAWATHSHPTNTASVAITETAFATSDLSAGEAAFLNTGCAAIGGSGSGAGVCPGCLLGGLNTGLTPAVN